MNKDLTVLLLSIVMGFSMCATIAYNNYVVFTALACMYIHLIYKISTTQTKYISTRRTIVIDKTGLRLNNPRFDGTFLSKLDRFIFRYGNKKYGLPCFLPLPKIKKQLVIGGTPSFRGGGISGYGEVVKIRPTIVDDTDLIHIQEAVDNKFFKVRNFEYNGWSGKLNKGYADFNVPINTALLSKDPGCYSCICSDGKVRHIPGWAIEGIELIFKPRPVEDEMVIFGLRGSS